MNEPADLTNPASPPRVAFAEPAPFRGLLVSVAIVWAIGMLLTWLLAIVCFPQRLPSLLGVGLASGVIAVAAITPACWLRSNGPQRGGRWSRRRQVQDWFSSFLAAIGSAMLIRLVGTVALLAMCRYQLGPSVEFVAVAVIMWYVALTATEVFTLAKRTDPPKLARGRFASSTTVLPLDAAIERGPTVPARDGN